VIGALTAPRGLGVIDEFKRLQRLVASVPPGPTGGAGPFPPAAGTDWRGERFAPCG
jgi:hypothetical protein